MHYIAFGFRVFAPVQRQDGGNIYRNAEFYFFQVCSALTSGGTLDTNFPFLAVPCGAMDSDELFQGVIDEVTDLVSWDFKTRRTGRRLITQFPQGLPSKMILFFHYKIAWEESPPAPRPCTRKNKNTLHNPCFSSCTLWDRVLVFA